MRATTTILLIILSLLASGKAWSQGKGSYSLIETEHFLTSSMRHPNQKIVSGS
ncbi:MAG: hypothetical protein PHC95_03100 [Parabacteroides sp.]|nr:hypothetical protein [Parabacteroides sp.]